MLKRQHHMTADYNVPKRSLNKEGLWIAAETRSRQQLSQSPVALFIAFETNERK
jgi:hypothetical protein